MNDEHYRWIKVGKALLSEKVELRAWDEYQRFGDLLMGLLSSSVLPPS